MNNETYTESPKTAGCRAPASGSGLPALEPLKRAEWRFPLGSCDALLLIEAREDGEIEPEDMDALIELAAFTKRQLIRRYERLQDTEASDRL